MGMIKPHTRRSYWRSVEVEASATEAAVVEEMQACLGPGSQASEFENLPSGMPLAAQSVSEVHVSCVGISLILRKKGKPWQVLLAEAW